MNWLSGLNAAAVALHDNLVYAFVDDEHVMPGSTAEVGVGGNRHSLGAMGLRNGRHERGSDQYRRSQYSNETESQRAPHDGHTPTVNDL